MAVKSMGVIRPMGWFTGTFTGTPYIYQSWQEQFDPKKSPIFSGNRTTNKALSDRFFCEFTGGLASKMGVYNKGHWKETLEGDIGRIYEGNHLVN